MGWMGFVGWEVGCEREIGWEMEGRKGRKLGWMSRIPMMPWLVVLHRASKGVILDSV